MKWTRLVFTTLLSHRRSVSLLLPRCDYRTHNAQITGTISSENPFGRLPAAMFGGYLFNFVLLACYAVCLLFWLIRMGVYSSEVVSIHRLILGLLFLATFSSFLHVLYLRRYNLSGVRSTAMLVSVSLVNMLLDTMLRVVLIIASLG